MNYYYELSTNLGTVLENKTIHNHEKGDSNTTVQWAIANIKWLLDNQTNREIYVVPDLCDATASQTNDIRFEIKMKLLRKDNEVIEIYYKPRQSALVETIFESYISEFGIESDDTIVKDLSWSVEDEWHLAAVLFKSVIFADRNLDDCYEWDLVFRINFNVLKAVADPTLPMVYGPQWKNNERGDDENEYDLGTHLELIFVSKTLSDVTVRSVEGEEFLAHRVLLAARSDVLRAHLEHDTVETRTRIIDTAFHADTVKGMLCYIYTGTVPNISEIPDKLLVAADFYLIKGLKELSANKLIENLAIENAIQTLELAHLHSALELKDQALEFIYKNPKYKIIQTKGWKSLQTVELLKTIYEYKANLKDNDNEMVVKDEEEEYDENQEEEGYENEHQDDKSKNESTELDCKPISGLYGDLMKLFNKGPPDFYDTVIKSVDDQKFHVHKVILAARSEVFKAHFEHNEETSISTIESPFEANILQNILHFMYTDLVKADELSVKLLEATDFYQLQGLKILCEKHLSKILNVENAIEYLEHAETYRAPCLMRHCLKYINDGPSNDIIRSEGWKGLQSAELVKRIHECKIDG